MGAGHFKETRGHVRSGEGGSVQNTEAVFDSVNCTMMECFKLGARSDLTVSWRLGGGSNIAI